jgi:hypothetical protein
MFIIDFWYVLIVSCITWISVAVNSIVIELEAKFAEHLLLTLPLHGYSSWTDLLSLEQANLDST